MRKQLITVAACIVAVAFAFEAGTVIASHLSSSSNNNGKYNSTGRNWFGTGSNGPRHSRPFPGGGGFFGQGLSANVVFGRVTKVSGDKITISSFRGSAARTVAVNSSTKYTKRSFSSSGPTSSSASLSNVKVGTMIFAQGSKSNGTLVAKSISISTFQRPSGGFRGFGPGGFGGGNWRQVPGSGSQSPSSGSGTSS